MQKITIHPFSVSVDWHLAEVLHQEATVELLDHLSPGGSPFVSWQAAGIVCPPGEHCVRVRLERHDGPMFVEISATDAVGRTWRAIAGESYSNSTITVSAAPSMLR